MQLIKFFIILLFCVSNFINAENPPSPLTGREKIFTEIYEKTLSKQTPEGSLLENMRPFVDMLQTFLVENNIHSVVEVGCGDWKVARYISWGDIQYRGYDIVKSVVEKNQKKFGNSKVQFIHADALSTDLPSADLLICKNVLQHFSNNFRNILSFLSQTHKFKHCLIVNDITFVKESSKHNYRIQTGGYHPLNLSQQPFKVNGSKLFNMRQTEP